MNLIFFMVKGLGHKDFYDSYKSFPVLKATIDQSINYLNFRFSNPYYSLFSDLVNKTFGKKMKEHLQFSMKRINQLEEHKEVICKKKFSLIFEVDCSRKKNAADKAKQLSSSIAYVLKNLDKKDLLEKSLIVVCCHPSLETKEKESVVFKKCSNDLYDNSVHGALTIFHPRVGHHGVANSIDIENLLLSIEDELAELHLLKDNILDIPRGRSDIRFDIASKFENRFYFYLGLRGPMFQYYCRVNRKSKICEDQEMYDLNNDIQMNNNLIPIMGNLNPVVGTIALAYKERLYKKFLSYDAK